MTRRHVVLTFIWLWSMVWALAIERTDFLDVWAAYTLAFAAYALMVFSRNSIAIPAGLGLALLIRVISYFFDPGLSDDYFRFIWDGMLSGEGMHPMAYTPDELMQHPEIISPPPDLFQKLNHTAYHSVYPPIAQWIYWLSYQVNGLHIAGHILFLKSIAILADGMIVWLLFQLVKLLQLPANRILLYALNPLIILEFSGNLHLDNLMIAGVLAAVWLAERGKIVSSGLAMSMSILSKLFSAMLLPFMPIYRSRQAWTGVITVTLMVTLLTLIYFFRGQTTWISSIGLWFKTFEFNASVYYVARAFGYFIWGYNRIDLIGPMMGVLTILGLGVIWWQYVFRSKIQWPSAMLFAATIYLLMGTTIHPWYLALPFVLSVLSGHTYMVAWTYLVFLSYSHYDGGGFREQYALLAVEYTLLLSWMLMEWIRHRALKEKPV